MNILLTALKDACGKYQLQKKVLLLNSFSAGYQLLESLASAGTPWINVTVNTPYELAKELAFPELEFRGYKILSEGQFLLLLAEVIDDMQNRGELIYFASLDREEGMAGIFSKSIRELRLAGVDSSNLELMFFMNEQKGAELTALLKGFERKLEEHRLADEAFVYRAALELLQKRNTENSTTYIIPEGLELQFLPYQFLLQVTGGSPLILPEDQVINPPYAPRFSFSAHHNSSPWSPFSYLFVVSDNPFPKDGDIEICRAYGNVNEVSEVFRRMKKDNIPLDEALVCYTHGNTYIPLIYSAAVSLGIPVTFAEGVPVFLSRPGKFINSLLNWLQDNCSVSWLTRLLKGGFMNISRGNIYAKLLRNSGVGWGVGRYSPCLEAVIDQIQDEADMAAKEGPKWKKEYLASRLKQVRELNDLLQDFLTNTSEFSYGETINASAFCDGLSRLVRTYAVVKSPEDAAARESLLQELEEAAVSFPRPTAGKAVLKTLTERVNSLMAGSSGPEPGFLHVTPFIRREAVQRPHTFVMGLDSSSFPGKGLQDPILLDKERENISQNLFPHSAGLERNVCRLASFLASRRGKIFLSFSCYDPVQGRSLNPAPLLLQVYRLQQRRPYADYSEFLCSLPSPSCYFSSEEKAVLGEEDAWLQLTLRKKYYAGSLAEVRSCYPGLDQGIRAEEARSSPQLTAYDGKITIDPGKHDPRLNPKKSISVTGMETLAKCPFAYFLNYILGVRPPKELVYEPSCWLDALNRGILLHEIYSTYLRDMAGQDSTENHQKERLFEIAQDLIGKMLEQVPAPSPVIFEREREDIIRGLEIFLRLEEELKKEENFAAYLEVAFGLGPREAEAAGLGKADPVWIKLPGGREAALRGRIDRIDKTPEKGVFRLWDFKTGSTFGFEEKDYIKQGRRLQHALYAAAAEDIFQDKGMAAKITEAGYLFPTEKGEGRRYVLDQCQRETALQALDIILNILSSGAFFAAHDKKRCRFCDYADACRFPASVERIEVKMAESKEEAVLAWKELQSYE